MFDLDPRVDFDEVEIVILVDDELDRARVGVIGPADHSHRRLADRLASFGGQCRTWAPLRSVSGDAAGRCNRVRGSGDVAVQIGDDLNFDVSRLARHTFPGRRHRCRKPRRLRCGPGPDADFSIDGSLAHSHPLAATAGGRFDQNRVADVGGDSDRLVIVIDQTIAARDHGHPEAIAIDRAVFLSPSISIASGVGPMKSISQAANFIEVGVLRQKAVAGVDRVDAADFGRADDLIDPQIAVRAAWRADAERLIGQADVHRIGVGLAVNGDRLDPHLATGSNDSQRDLASVGDQNPVVHRRGTERSQRVEIEDGPTERDPPYADVSTLNSGRPKSTACWSSTKTATT
jgi:hypothetical protein